MIQFNPTSLVSTGAQMFRAVLMAGLVFLVVLLRLAIGQLCHTPILTSQPYNTTLKRFTIQGRS